MTVPLERQKNIADVGPRVREQLGLGSASVEDATAFATSAQGEKADSALPAKELPITATRNGMASILLPPGMISLEVRGFAAIGDAGGAKYRRISFADLTGYPALSYVRSLDRFMPNGSIDAVNGGYWVIDEKEIKPQMLGAVVDGVTDVTAACNAAAALAEIIGADLRFTAGKHVLDPANGVALSTATYAYGHSALQAALVLPYKVKVRTAGTNTELCFVNMNSTNSVGVAVSEDSGTGVGFSHKSFSCEGFLIRSIGAHGLYGFITPSNDSLFGRKRPVYEVQLKFAGETDDKTVLLHGWTVATLLGDCTGGNIEIYGYGTYNPTIADDGQHQSTMFKVKAAKGAFGFKLYFSTNTFRTFLDLSDGLEGFQVDGEGQGGWYGIDFTSATGEPGGNLGKIHLNVNKAGVRVVNRSGLTVEDLQVYRAPAYYDHGQDWSAIEGSGSSFVRVKKLEVNHSDAPTTRVASAGVGNEALYNVNSRCGRFSNGVRARVNDWQARSTPVAFTIDGGLDCCFGDGETNGVTNVFELKGAPLDIRCGDVTVANVMPTSYFTSEATVDKRRVRFPPESLIQTSARLELVPAAAGSTTVKKRVTASNLHIAPSAGSGAYVYDIILDRAHMVDGDSVVAKVIGFGSANPTLRFVDDAGTVIRSFTSANAGSGTFWKCEFFYNALNNAIRGTVTQSSI
ncbi:hypothetical protein N5C81_14935 [Rhizobium pusense]|uniref:hypothetical protein n=1 Tax=Agrobacterium pusense TaxID=648995 RepID=UPI00244D4C5A|nr:hypothetical protein [Agrobacterium pusense]MDH1268918.1 hypothetical protein [Agrobacterium pusense]